MVILSGDGIRGRHWSRGSSTLGLRGVGITQIERQGRLVEEFGLINREAINTFQMYGGEGSQRFHMDLPGNHERNPRLGGCTRG